MTNPPIRKPNNPPMTEEEMEAAEIERADNKLFKGGKIELALMPLIQDDLDGSLERINLDNFDRVKSQTVKYIKSCENSGTLPTVIGLARALGHSRRSIYKFLDTSPNTKSARFLEIVRDAMSELLDTASLFRKVDNATAIFIQKSIFQRIDRAELTINSGKAINFDGDDDEITIEALKAKYGIPESEDN